MFDISKLKNKNKTEDISDIIRLTDILRTGTLSTGQTIKLGQALGAIYTKDIASEIFEKEIQISDSTTENYYEKLVKDYTNFLSSPSIDQAALDEMIHLQLLEEKHENPQIERMQTALNLNPLEDGNNEKRKFMAEQMTPSNLSNILTQRRRVPMVQELINILRDTYAKWEDANSKSTLEPQHQYLAMICNALSEIKGEKNEWALMQLSLEDFLVAFEEDLSFKEIIEKALEKIKNETTIPSKIELEQKRAEAPISKEMLHKTADLLSTIHKVKQNAVELQPKDLKPLEDSANIVIPLKDTSEIIKNQIIAYYKEGKDSEKATGEMERLIWEFAGMMGLEEFFAPTAKIALRTAEEGGDGKQMMLSKEGELIERQGLSAERRGGIQIAHQGISLLNYINKPKERKSEISHEQIIKATLITVLFGMFDAHEKNIIVDDKGNLKFFDNTKSMPHSNTSIINGDVMFPSYRSGLFQLQGSYQDLSPEERCNMQKEISAYKNKIEIMEKFLKSSAVQKRLEKLPPGWFNSDEAMAALKERVGQMENAIQDPNVKSLCDFVFAVNPDFKFFAALHVFKDLHMFPPHMSLDIPLQKSLCSVGYSSVGSLIDKAVEKRIDPEKVRLWCADPTLSLKNVLEKMFQEFRSSEKNSTEECQKHGDEILAEVKKKAKVDYKDSSRKESIAYALGFAIKSLKNVGLPVYSTNSNQIGEIFRTENSKMIIQENLSTEPPELTLHYKNSEGVIKYVSIDYLTKAGSLKVDGQFLSPEQIIFAYSK